MDNTTITHCYLGTLVIELVVGKKVIGNAPISSWLSITFSDFFFKKFRKEIRNFPASRVFVLDNKFWSKRQKVKTRN